MNTVGIRLLNGPHARRHRRSRDLQRPTGHPTGIGIESLSISREVAIDHPTGTVHAIRGRIEIEVHRPITVVGDRDRLTVRIEVTSTRGNSSKAVERHRAGHHQIAGRLVDRGVFDALAIEVEILVSSQRNTDAARASSPQIHVGEIDVPLPHPIHVPRVVAVVNVDRAAGGIGHAEITFKRDRPHVSEFHGIDSRTTTRIINAKITKGIRPSSIKRFMCGPRPEVQNPHF